MTASFATGQGRRISDLMTDRHGGKSTYLRQNALIAVLGRWKLRAARRRQPSERWSVDRRYSAAVGRGGTD